MTYRMTDEAMREAIARAVGIDRIWSYALPQRTIRGTVPKYPDDLNAIREAVCALPEELQLAFNERLHAVAFVLGKMIHQLGAADWCQIYCRTVGCSCGCGVTIWECSERRYYRALINREAGCESVEAGIPPWECSERKAKEGAK